MPTPPSPSSSSPDAPGGRLDGWKEIAAYLGRSVRTVQRWESLYKLPVYRMGTGRGENVHAFERELDAWLAGIRWTRRDGESANGLDREPEGPPGTAPDGAPADSASAAAEATGRQDEGAPVQAGARGRAFGGWRLWLLGAGFLAAAALAGFFLMARPTTLQPSTFKIDGNTLRVYDVNGRQVFAYRSPTGLLKAARYTQPEFTLRRIVIEDIDGDGSLETVFLRPAEFNQEEFASELVCLDAHGRVRFTHRATDSVQFGDRTYAPPWGGSSLFITGPRSRRQLWVAWIHIESGQFPCLLERIDGRGRPVSKYWSAGYVDLVAPGVLAGVPSIFVGAANNDHKGASLAAFPENDVNGSAPADDPDKVCRNCPPGGPTAFFVFPRLEFLAMNGNFPFPTSLKQQATGEFRLTIAQGDFKLGGNSKYYGGTDYYELAPDLTPIRAGFNAEYVAAHHEAERDKYVDHPFGDVDYAQLWPVLVWKDGKFVPVVGQTDR